MLPKLSVADIQKLGFDWPKYAPLEQYAVIQNGQVDLAKTIENLESSRAYYRQQLAEAYAFKMRTGADYADFTDRRDDNARTERELGQAIAYLQRIVAAVGNK